MYHASRLTIHWCLKHLCGWPRYVVRDQLEQHLVLVDPPIAVFGGEGGFGFEYVQADLGEASVLRRRPELLYRGDAGDHDTGAQGWRLVVLTGGTQLAHDIHDPGRLVIGEVGVGHSDRQLG